MSQASATWDHSSNTEHPAWYKQHGKVGSLWYRSPTASPKMSCCWLLAGHMAAQDKLAVPSLSCRSVMHCDYVKPVRCKKYDVFTCRKHFFKKKKANMCPGSSSFFLFHPTVRNMDVGDATWDPGKPIPETVNCKRTRPMTTSCDTVSSEWPTSRVLMWQKYFFNLFPATVVSCFLHR